MRKILSIVIPMYNSKEFIAKCLDSFLVKNDMECIEIIVVNDGSSDGCEKIARQYAERYPNSIKVITQENGGHGAAVDKGIKHCTGTYFKVVDADDWIVKGHLEKFLDTLKKVEESDVIVCGFETYNIQNNGINRIFASMESEIEYFTMSELMNKWAQYRKIFTLHGITYKTAFYREYGIDLPRNVFYDDAIYITVAVSNAKKICVLDQNLYVYRVGDVNQSVSNDNRVARMEHVEKVIQIMCNSYKKKRPEAGQKYFEYKTCSVITDFLITAFLRCKRKRVGRKEAKKVLKEISEESKEILGKIKKRYLMLMFLSYLHFDAKIFDKLLNRRK